MNKDEFLSIEGLDVYYRQNKQNITAVQNVNLTLAEGKFGVIIGPSGCGKSTLLNVVSGLHHNYQGKVLIDKHQPDTYSDTALILQEYGLLPWKTVWDNIMLGLQIKRLPKQEAIFKTEKILEQMGLTSLAKRYPAQLSGGQRQRIAIARSLVLNPRLLLMDEPFSSLDALTREKLQEFLLSIWRETKLTILLITHNIEEAVFLGQEIFVMSPFPGTIIQRKINHLAGSYDSRGKIEFLKMTNDLRSLLLGGTKNEKKEYQFSL